MHMHLRLIQLLSIIAIVWGASSQVAAVGQAVKLALPVDDPVEKVVIRKTSDTVRP